MAVIRMNEVKKLSKQQAKEKLAELERSMLELLGEGKREKKKSLKQAIARIKTYIHQLESKEQTDLNKNIKKERTA